MHSPKTYPLETRLAAAWPPHGWKDITVLLAISGGADSVAMLRAMLALRTAGEGRLVAAHLNHRLRGEQSQADETFVSELCRRLKIPCEVGRIEIDALASRQREGLEEAARNARYEFLEHTAARLGARYIVTAHTADDQAETILHRIIRGTGIGGLSGMSRVRLLGPATTLIRPMLGIRRAELLGYLEDLGQTYRSDASNTDIRFTRNRIRHQLLPQLADDFNPGVVDALLRLGTLAGEMQDVVDRLVGALWQQCVALEESDAVRINVGLLAGQPRYVIRELFMALWRKKRWPMQAMGFVQWDLLAEMTICKIAGKVAETSQGGSERAARYTFPGNVLAETDGTIMRLGQACP